MKSMLFLIAIYFCSIVHAQRPTNEMVKQKIDSINRLLDHAVVKKDMATLRKHYAEDFVFTHGTGLVDSKSSWLKNVAAGTSKFVSREHDSTVVELHQDIAIISGTLTVRKEDAGYALRYVRVFANRNKLWQMVSHRTTAEWHF
jgi:ketosteroid isomerase-like protein